jgi:hypothetical protein
MAFKTVHRAALEKNFLQKVGTNNTMGLSPEIQEMIHRAALDEGELAHSRKPLLVNFFGGPGCGKSTLMAASFADFKWLDKNVEMAPEFAKQLCWEERTKTVKNQHYVLCKQHQCIARLIDNVDIIITDGPLLLSMYYREQDDMTEVFNQYALALHNSFINLNYFIERKKKYNPKGRYQNEVEAKQADVDIKVMLDLNNISYKVIPGVRDVDIIVHDVLQYLGD